MGRSRRGSRVAAFIVAWIVAPLAASAVPVHAVPITPPAHIAAFRSVRPAVMRYVRSPSTMLGRRSGVEGMTFTALPLRLPLARRPMLVLPAFVPRLSLEGALAPLLLASACSPARPGVLIAALPRTPVNPIACGSIGVMPESAWPSALVPGRDKNALYGPAYAPRDIDDF